MNFGLGKQRDGTYMLVYQYEVGSPFEGTAQQGKTAYNLADLKSHTHRFSPVLTTRDWHVRDVKCRTYQVLLNGATYCTIARLERGTETTDNEAERQRDSDTQGETEREAEGQPDSQIARDTYKQQPASQPAR